MKKLIFLELALLFLATTFQSDNPPGWYQQTLPVSDNINDIFFLDSLNGWAVTDYQGVSSDTSYILSTTDGGNNWEINYKTFVQFKTIQFTDSAIGYACGIGPGPELFKSTNGGVNWEILNVLTFTWKSDLNFINKDTGWVCSSDPFDGGVFKTTNGGLSWVQQVNLTTANPKKIFFIDNDTGWIGNENGRLYKTTNSGVNWNLQYNSIASIEAIFFNNSQNGWIRGGTTGNIIGISYTTNGGVNWINSVGNTIGGFDVKFINDSIGYAGTYSSFKVMKSTNGGKNWGYQNTPIFSQDLISVLKDDTLNAWAGQLIHTEDGGGKIILTEISETNLLKIDNFTLSQNSPNPFNPKTKINYEIKKSGFINLTVYDIRGSKISVLINRKQNPGNYEMGFDGSNLNSGVYFYKIIVIDEKSNDVFSETKSMLLIK
ncbi:MAG: T9SS type A sorting domain-containing protein [Bacteroidetes bacterium]|nr:T9SS type A sorting domain-containing protein [Bacteroidota bacterium]